MNLRIGIPRDGSRGTDTSLIVDLNAETVEVRRQPEGDAFAGLHGARRGETVAPLALPEFAVMVDDLP